MTRDEAFKTLTKDGVRFPHCDLRILHAPTECEYCDEHPDWQAYRIAMGIAFTGDTDPKKTPCPSAIDRPAQRAHRWAGNRPTNVNADTSEPLVPSMGDRLREE